MITASWARVRRARGSGWGDSNSTLAVSSMRGQGAVGRRTCGFGECPVTALVRRCPRFAIRLRTQHGPAPLGHGWLRHGRSLGCGGMAGPCRGDSRHALKGIWVSTMAEPDASIPDLLARAEQAQAQSRTLRERVAEAAEAVAQVEEDVARVHAGLAERGGSLAAQAREHARRAREFAAKEHAEADRLRMDGPAEDGWPERAD
jgi:hypothetical protein